MAPGTWISALGYSITYPDHGEQYQPNQLLPADKRFSLINEKLDHDVDSHLPRNEMQSIPRIEKRACKCIATSHEDRARNKANGSEHPETYRGFTQLELLSNIITAAFWYTAKQSYHCHSQYHCDQFWKRHFLMSPSALRSCSTVNKRTERENVKKIQEQGNIFARRGHLSLGSFVASFLRNVWGVYCHVSPNINSSGESASEDSDAQKSTNQNTTDEFREN